VIENFIRTKSPRKILAELKPKVCIFIGTKNISNSIFKYLLKNCYFQYTFSIFNLSNY